MLLVVVFTKKFLEYLLSQGTASGPTPFTALSLSFTSFSRSSLFCVSLSGWIVDELNTSWHRGEMGQVAYTILYYSGCFFFPCFLFLWLLCIITWDLPWEYFTLFTCLAWLPFLFCLLTFELILWWILKTQQSNERMIDSHQTQDSVTLHQVWKCTKMGFKWIWCLALSLYFVCSYVCIYLLY